MVAVERCGAESARSLTLDSGAVRAVVSQRRSLLPAGITALSGKFFGGDVVELHDPDGQMVARGVVAYDAAYGYELGRIVHAGLDPKEIVELVLLLVAGYFIRDALANQNIGTSIGGALGHSAVFVLDADNRPVDLGDDPAHVPHDAAGLRPARAVVLFALWIMRLILKSRRRHRRCRRCAGRCSRCCSGRRS